MEERIQSKLERVQKKSENYKEPVSQEEKLIETLSEDVKSSFQEHQNNNNIQSNSKFSTPSTKKSQLSYDALSVQEETPFQEGENKSN